MGKKERELEEKEGILGMGRAKMEKVVVEEKVMEGVVAMEGMEIEAKEAEGIHMVGSKEESTLRHSKILKILADFHIEWHSSSMAYNSVHSSCIYRDCLA